MLNPHSRILLKRGETREPHLIKWIDSCVFLCYLIVQFSRRAFGKLFNDIINE
jgi:hypothetical protein